MSRFLILFFLLMAQPVWAIQDSQMLVNRLDGHSSPYLNMHGKDPVAWQQWGPEAFEIARRENRLLFVSVGYFACHWCHVMQRESYQNPLIADVINQYYVPIKIDRELLPGIDKRLMDFTQRTRGRGGWPLNIFLTPDGYPLIAVMYEPPQRFKRLLEKLHPRWAANPAELGQLARDAQHGLAAERALSSADYDPTSTREARLAPFFLRVMARADEVAGGFGDQTKFPSTPQLEALLSLDESKADEEITAFLELTLEQMASQGLRDHLGGGFFRYTVDQNWQVPHFEKMLYDNAQLAYVYLQAEQVLADKVYGQVAFNTLDFILRDLAAEQGGYIASLSAVDDKGVEGGAYLWADNRLTSLLSEQELMVLRPFWSLIGHHDLEEGWLPKQAMSIAEVAADVGLPVDKVGVLIDQAKAKLVTARASRVAPRDIKVLAAWNGMVLRALAKATGSKGGARFKAPATALAHLLQNQMWDGKQLRRSLSDATVQSTLADYAQVAEGFLEWYRVSGDDRHRDFAETLIRTAWPLFHNESGWKMGQDELLKYGVEQLALDDGVLSAPSAVLIRSGLSLVKMGRLPDLAEKLEDARQAGYVADAFWGISHLRL